MVYFILKRIVQSVFVMAAVAFLAFSLFRFVGDPITQMTGVETSVEDQERLRDELGLNDPFVSNLYVSREMVQGDFGFSYRTRQPVANMIADRIPATLELGVVALIISLLVGVPAGVYTALKLPRGFDSNHFDDHSGWRVDPNLCDRHHVDIYLWCPIGLAANVWARWHGSYW
jgi:peptide/nickel transport system permease protein